MNTTLISVVIATYNRSELLKRALHSLNSQTLNSCDFEVIIIDNNSTDETKTISQQFITESSLNIRYFFERTQGLSYARNRGFKEASAHYVAYLDDDAIAFENWLEVAKSIITTHKPDGFGGPYYPYFTSEKPDWFNEDAIVGRPYDKTGWLPSNKELYGTNMFFTKTLLNKLGGFNTDLGMVGNSLGFAEESLLVYKAHENGYKLYYSEDLKVKHLVASCKYNPLFTLSEKFPQGTSRYKLKKALNHPVIKWGESQKELSNIYSYLSSLYNNINDMLSAIKEGKQPDHHSLINTNKVFCDIGFKLAQYKDNFSTPMFNALKNSAPLGKIWIYGTGKHSLKFLSDFMEFKETIHGFIDDNPQEKLWNGFPVKKLTDLKEDSDIIVICSSDTFEEGMAEKVKQTLDSNTKVVLLYS